jgi:N-acetylglucosaminyl-diphospho-decaprenol L-rhamnosyltransferase
MTRADVAVVVVNFNSSDFLRGFVESLGAAGGGEQQIVIVDNGSRPEDRDAAHALAGPHVRVVDAPDNPGYGGGLNLGLALTTAPFVVFSNPDVRVRAGAFDVLRRRVEGDPIVGAAGPRTFMDDGMTLQHPMNRLPTPSRFAGAVRALGAPGFARRFADGYTRFAMRYWASVLPRPIEMLSGAFLFTRRDVIEKVGAFDESFPLYFEDADWCARLRAFGYRLEYVPDAHIVHYHNVSGSRAPDVAAQRLRIAEERFASKHFGRVGKWRYRRAAKRRAARLAAGPPVFPWAITRLGTLAEPPSFPARGPALAEIAGAPLFDYPVATFVGAEPFRIPPDLWARMGPGPWFVRIVLLDGTTVVGAWTFEK